jgi:hypothetical protein
VGGLLDLVEQRHREVLGGDRLAHRVVGADLVGAGALTRCDLRGRRHERPVDAVVEPAEVVERLGDDEGLRAVDLGEVRKVDQPGSVHEQRACAADDDQPRVAERLDQVAHLCEVLAWIATGAARTDRRHDDVRLACHAFGEGGVTPVAPHRDDAGRYLTAGPRDAGDLVPPLHRLGRHPAADHSRRAVNRDPHPRPFPSSWPRPSYPSVTEYFNVL